MCARRWLPQREQTRAQGCSKAFQVGLVTAPLNPWEAMQRLFKKFDRVRSASVYRRSVSIRSSDAVTANVPCRLAVARTRPNGDWRLV